MSEVLLSIDLGTTRLKVAAFRLDGTLQQLVVRRHEEHGDAAGKRWQSAERWWQDTVAAVRELLERLPAAEVLGLSVSGRGGAAVFVDGRGGVVADPWSDARHRETAGQLATTPAGQALSTYGLALVAKYLWLERHEPELAGQVALALYAKDWLVYRLTGVSRTDPSSGPDALRWPDEIGGLELPAGLLPEPGLPWSLAGGLTSAAGTALGLAAGTPVALGAHDGVAANIGAAAFDAGAYAVTLGTHAVVRTVTSTVPAADLRFYGFPPHGHVLGANAWFAGRSVDWYLELLGAAADGGRAMSYATLETEARRVLPGAAGARFFPYLGGRGGAAPGPVADAAFTGLGLGHGRAELGRAVLEGASCAVRTVFERVRGACGPVRRLRATGGGSESVLWLEILAALLGEPIEVTGRAVEARGVAMCLAVALGIHPDIQAAAAAMVSVERCVEPDPDAVAAYETVYRHWQNVSRIRAATP
jgi:sugar (pentulose or hexulose) kinase